MKGLERLFNRKKENYKSNNNFKVLLIEENSSSLNEALGISEERHKEIIEFSIDAYKEGERYTDSCKIAIEKCNHINEVVVAMTTLAKVKTIADNPLAAILESKFGGE
jgi:hypothetical protein